jgi:hypothetical protein
MRKHERVRIVAFITDLMDRSRLGAAGSIEFTTDPGAAAGADVVVVDLARFEALLDEIRSIAPAARIIGVGPHVDTESFVRATAAGADEVLARSRFFRDPAAVLGAGPDSSGEGPIG